MSSFKCHQRNFHMSEANFIVSQSVRVLGSQYFQSEVKPLIQSQNKFNNDNINNNNSNNNNNNNKVYFQ